MEGARRITTTPRIHHHPWHSGGGGEAGSCSPKPSLLQAQGATPLKGRPPRKSLVGPALRIGPASRLPLIPPGRFSLFQRDRRAFAVTEQVPCLPALQSACVSVKKKKTERKNRTQVPSFVPNKPMRYFCKLWRLGYLGVNIFPKETNITDCGSGMCVPHLPPFFLGTKLLQISIFTLQLY